MKAAAPSASIACAVGLLGVTITVGVLWSAIPRPQTVPVPLDARTRSATGPLRVDSSHSHYFRDAHGRAVYLTGSHTWDNLQDRGATDPPPEFDFEEYLGFLQQRRHNFIRLWRQELTQIVQRRSGQNSFSGPHPWLRTGSGTALDGKPRFDLGRFDPVYFNRLRNRVQTAGSRGIYVSVMLFEGWFTQFAPDSWRGHPFNPANNVNGIDCDVNRDGRGLECFTLAKPEVTRIQEAYVRHVIDHVNDLDNVLYEISNENHWESYDWQVHFVQYAREYEKSKPEQHPIGLTSIGGGGRDDTARLLASPADWISPNPLTYDYRGNPPASLSDHVVITDTDHLWGVGGDRAWVWKSFTRGLNPIFMDPYEERLRRADDDAQREQWESVRMAMGHTSWFADRMDLGSMTPRPELASTGYCLANPGVEYLVYAPPGSQRTHTSLLQRLLEPLGGANSREVSVDLNSSSGRFAVRWFDPSSGNSTDAAPVQGGAQRRFTAPFPGEDAVLHLRLMQ